VILRRGEQMINEKCKKRKKKGEIGLGAILVVFIGIIVAIPLFLAVSQTVGTSTDTVSVANTTLTSVVNGTPQYLTGYASISNVVVYNATGDVIVGSGNYTVENHVVYNGAEAVKITPNASADFKSAWKVSGTAEPLGYISGAGRSVALLIPIFFALLIAVIALTPTLRDGLKELMGM